MQQTTADYFVFEMNYILELEITCINIAMENVNLYEKQNGVSISNFYKKYLFIILVKSYVL